MKNSNISVNEAAKRLGYSRNSIYTFLREGLIKSVRIGKGKFRIPEDEIEKFQKVKKQDVGLVKPSVPQTIGGVLESALLPAPRPGKSLADLGGESVFHTIGLWLEERVGLPKLFDWLTSLTAVILGVSLFLYSSQTDILSIGRLSMWLDPIRLTLVFGGLGLVLAAMIQPEVGSKFNLVNLFRLILMTTFLGLAIILLSGGDIDGFLIYGLFGLAIMVEALTGVRSSTVYMLYIFGLLAGIFLIYRFFPDGAGLSVVISGIKNVFNVYDWILTILVVVLIITGLYGYFWNKKFLKDVSVIYGVLLCVLALFYGAGNYWSRAFVLLITGMVGMLLPSWESFKTRIETDRQLVFKMFGTVMMSFAICILIIAAVQGVLVSNAYRNLSDKADFASREMVDIYSETVQAATDLAKNPSFVSAFVGGRGAELTNQLRYLSLGKPEVVLTEVINSKGKPLAVYPSSITLGSMDFSKASFFTSVMRSGTNYISPDLENLGNDLKNVILVAVPAVDGSDTTTGVILTVLSGINLTNELQAVGVKTFGQSVIVVGESSKTIVYPDVAKLGMTLNEGDTSYDIWKNGITKTEGYNWNGVHSVFGAAKDTDYGLTIVVSQPIAKVLDVSTSWLAWILFLQLLVGIVVFVSFIYIKNTRVKEET